MKAVIETGIPAPSVRRHRRRLTDELRGLLPGQSAVVDKATAVCLKDFGRRNGWEMAQAQVSGADWEETGMVRVWRIS